MEVRFKKLLREKGLKVTEQRMLVLEVLEEYRGQHLTVEEIYAEVQKKCPDIGLATIYRTVQLLLDRQLVDRISLDDRCIRYEIWRMPEGEEKRHHHHHLICTTCGAVLPFDADLLEELEQHIEKATGFHVTDHELKFYGQCAACARKEK